MRRSSMQAQSEGRQHTYSHDLLEQAIQKHCLLALTGEYEQLPRERQLILIAWVREANRLRIDQRKRVALIIEARKLGLIEDVKKLE